MAFDNILGIHASALQLRAQRMNMLASNIANAATPNYKARDLDFAKALEMVGNGQNSEAAISYRIRGYRVLAQLRAFIPGLRIHQVADADLKLDAAVHCYLFNSQLLTTPDGLVTLEAVMCLAACDKAPMFQMQSGAGLTYHENMTVDKTAELIETLKK